MLDRLLENTVNTLHFEPSASSRDEFGMLGDAEQKEMLPDSGSSFPEAENPANSSDNQNSTNLNQRFGITARQQSINDRNSTLPGFFVIDNERGLIFFDQQFADMLGCEWTSRGEHVSSFLSFMSWDFRETLHSFAKAPVKNTEAESDAFGDSMNANITIVKGPMCGCNYMFNFKALARKPNGELLLGSGMASFNHDVDAKVLPHELGNDGSWDWDCDTGRTTFSESYRKMLGYEPSDYFPRHIEEWSREIVNPEDVKTTVDKQYLVLQSREYGDSFECVIRLKHKDGHYIWTLGRGMVLERDVTGKAKRMIGTNTNISLTQIYNVNTLLSSWVDNLTKTYNRRYLLEQYENYAKDYNQPLCCIFADVAGLKLINDYLGHEAGDELLCNAASILRNCFSRQSELIRLGGDEFILILFNCPQVLLEMTVSNIAILSASFNQTQPHRVPVLIGLGAASLSETQMNLREMISLAMLRAQDYKREKHSENYQQILKYVSKKLGYRITYHDSRQSVSSDEENVNDAEAQHKVKVEGIFDPNRPTKEELSQEESSKQRQQDSTQEVSQLFSDFFASQIRA